MTIPNPGSDGAVAQGCTCPVGDNARGRGFPIRGETMFWIDPDCPLHVKTDNQKEESQ